MNSKIYYIDCYQGENKEGNIGFVKLEDEKIFVMLRGIYAGSGMDCKVYAWDRKGQQTQEISKKQKGGANLSFSSKVKGELSLHFGNGRHCEIAEIAAYVNIYGQIAVFGGNFCLKIQTENAYAVKKCFTVLRKTLNMIAALSVRISGQKRQTKVYTLFGSDAAAILQATGILTIEKEQKKLKKRI